jgi:trans-aconitate methyltransferase
VSRTTPGYFERLYAADRDPWKMASSWYERRKYALTLAALPDEHYRYAFEPGCSIGVLTEGLARRCDRVLAVDLTSAATAIAAHRLRSSSNVEVRQSTVPDDWPEGPFDLLVLSEIGYYFDADELRLLLDRAVASLLPEATVIGVHWRGPTDYPLTAAETHRAITATPGLVPIVQHEDQEFLLHVWRLRSDSGAGPPAGDQINNG